MKATTMNSKNFESTYAMLVRCDEKERSVLETAIYVILILSMFFAVFQITQMRVVVPESLSARSVTSSVAAQPPRV
jgi:hypothetical protein